MPAPYLKEGWNQKLHVVTTISNSARFRSRYDLFEEFEIRMANAHVPFWVVELAFGERSRAISHPRNPRHILLRSPHEIWHKEAMVNIAVSRFPQDWEYMAWIDADVSFARDDWAEETVHMLQHHPIVQMWSEAQDLGPARVPFRRHWSFAKCYLDGIPREEHCPPYKNSKLKKDVVYWHPGFAWAMTREAWDSVGGLIDTAILGAADNHMAKALVGDAQYSFHPRVTDGYKKPILRWQELAEKHIRRNLGCVEGLLLHHWHGKKVDRRYWDRWKILVDGQFDPDTDLKYDWQRLWQLVDDGSSRFVKLRNGIRGYFQKRNEDSSDLDPSEIHM